MLKKIIFLAIALFVIFGVVIGVKGISKKDGAVVMDFSKLGVGAPKAPEAPKVFDPKKQVEESNEAAKDLARPYYEKMDLSVEQMKLHNEGMAKIEVLTKSIADERNAKSVEFSKVYGSGLTDEEKKEKVAKLSEEMNELNHEYDAIAAKTMETFVASLNPSQKEEWTKYQKALAKKFGVKK